MDKSIVKEKPRRTSGQKRQLRLLLFTAFSLVFIFAIAYFLFWPKEETFHLANYTYSIVEYRDFHSWVNSAGTLKPRLELELTAPFGGELGQWQIQPGQPVQEGQTLITISNEKLIEEIKRAEQEVLVSDLDYKKAKMEEEYEKLQFSQEKASLEERLLKAAENLALKEDFYKLDLIHRQELQEAQDALKRVEEELDRLDMRWLIRELQLQAGVALSDTRYQNALEGRKELQEQLQAGVIRAPRDGYILSVTTEGGREVNKGISLANFVADIGMHYLGEVDLKDSSLVEVGQEAIIQGLNADIAATVTYVSPLVKEGRNTVEIHIMPADQENLRANVKCSALIKVGHEPNRLALPRGPYLASGERLFVYLVEGERAFQRDVFFGMTEGNYIVIERGLEEGDIVITGSYEDFKRFKEIDIDPEGGRESD